MLARTIFRQIEIGLVLICFSLPAAGRAEQRITASDGSYVFTAEDGWKPRAGRVPVAPLLDLGCDNAAALTIVRESAEAIRGVATTEILGMKIEFFRQRGLPVTNATGMTTRTLAGMEVAEIEIDSVARDQNGIAIKSHLILTVVRESETAVLASVASHRIGADEKYRRQLRAILASIARPEKAPPAPAGK